MTKDEIQEKIDGIIKKFDDLQCGRKSIFEILTEPESVELLKNVLTLMEDELFFEVLFDAQFVQKKMLAMIEPDTDYQEIDGWDSSSPLMPILSILYALALDIRVTIGNSKKIYPDDPFASFTYKAYGFWGTLLGFDTVISRLLEEQDSNFKGTFYLNLKHGRRKYENEYKKLVEHLKKSNDNASALLFICDGTYSESVCLLKSEGKVNALVTNHVHAYTSLLIPESDQILCPGMKVKHDGNCSVHSEFNINAILYHALKEGSVAQTLIALKDNELNLEHMKLQPSDLTSEHENKHPDPLNFLRWMTKIGLLFVGLESKSWLSYCKKRKIHPIFGVKTDYQDWPIDAYFNYTIQSRKSAQNLADIFQLASPPQKPNQRSPTEVQADLEIPSQEPDQTSPTEVQADLEIPLFSSNALNNNTRDKPIAYSDIAVEGLLEELIQDIGQSNKGRYKGFTLNITNKTDKLQNILDWVQENPVLYSQNKNLVLGLIKSLCSIKRNYFGFYQPHSLNEFNSKINSWGINSDKLSTIPFNINLLTELEIEPPEETSDPVYK